MYDLKALGCAVGSIQELGPDRLHTRYVKLPGNPPSIPYVQGMPRVSIDERTASLTSATQFCLEAFEDAGHPIFGRMASKDNGNTITVRIADAFWKDGLLRYEMPGKGSGLSERREIVYHDLDAIWSWVTSDEGREQIRRRADALRDQLYTAIDGRPHLGLRNVMPIGVSTGQDDFVITWEVSFHALDPALSRRNHAFPLRECLGTWEGEGVDELLRKQDRRLPVKAKVGGDRFLVDQVAAPLIRQTIASMGIEAFMDMTTDPDRTMPKGTMPRKLFKRTYGAELPPGVERLTLKHGIMSARIRLATAATWDDGVLKYDGRIPASLEMTIKGNTGSSITDHPILKDKVVTGCRDQEGRKVITFADIHIPYKKAFRRTGLPDAY